MTRDILIVDDEPEKALPLVSALRSEGYSVRFAASGREALSMMQAKCPDFVICDLEMPEMGGYAVMEAMCTRLGLRDLPFVLANEDWEVGINWSLTAGGKSADFHCMKPYAVSEMCWVVSRIFRIPGGPIANSFPGYASD